MVQASSPSSLRKTTRRLGSGNNNNNNNRVVITQPSNLQSSNTNTNNNNNNSGGDNINDILRHQWLQESDGAPKMGGAMNDEDKATFLFEVAKYGQAQEGGAASSDAFGKAEASSVAMQASNSGGGGGVGDTSIASYEEWVSLQKPLQMGSTISGGSSSGNARSSSSRINMNAHGYYLSQQQLPSTAGGVDSSSSTGGNEGEAQLMQQAIPERQVILRPMSHLDDPNSDVTSSKKKPLHVPSLESTRNGGQQPDPEVYYYDAQGLVSLGSSPQSTPELTLPSEVFTASGEKLKLSDVHDGGRAEVFLEMDPNTALNELNSIPKSMSSGSASSFSSSSSTTATAGNAAQQSQDQMIVFLTVATMAIMVGMLSARRLRSRKFLEQCMTPDLDDDLDDVRRDKKFDGKGQIVNNNRYTAAAGAASYAYTTSGGGDGGSPGRRSEYEGSETSLPHFSDLYPTQSSSIMGSLSRRSGYGTNDEGMHWRGDMEKFDV